MVIFPLFFAFFHSDPGYYRVRVLECRYSNDNDYLDNLNSLSSSSLPPALNLPLDEQAKQYKEENDYFQEPPGPTSPLTDAALPTATPVQSRLPLFERSNHNALRLLLTQRALQTMAWYRMNMGDGVTAEWLEAFSGLEKGQLHRSHSLTLLEEHTWDGFLLSLLERKAQVVTLRVKRRGPGSGGWSKNNPYLQQRVVEIETKITPRSLVTSLLQIREQLAKEWSLDLTLIKASAGTIWSSRREMLSEARRAEEGGKDVSQAEEGGKDVTFLRMGTAPLVMVMPEGSTPLRTGTFDLLTTLTTHTACLALLAELRGKGEASAKDYLFLMQFYEARLGFFEGEQNYGRGEDFLEELMLQPTTVSLAPLELARRLLDIRSDFCDEWKDDLLSVELSQHSEVRKKLLDKRMKDP